MNLNKVIYFIQDLESMGKRRIIEFLNYTQKLVD